MAKVTIIFEDNEGPEGSVHISGSFEPKLDRGNVTLAQKAALDLIERIPESLHIVRVMANYKVTN
jgi:hypothetical protein